MRGEPSRLGQYDTPDASATVLRTILYSRRRALAAMFSRGLTFGLPAAVIGSSLLTFVLRGEVLQWEWLTAAAAVTIAACAAAAWLRRPSAVDMAVMLDRRLDLQDSVSAALTAAGNGTPIDSLVVRHAARRLDEVDAGAAFPLRWRPAVVSACTTAGLLMLAVAGGGHGTPVERPSGGRMISSGDAGAVAAEAEVDVSTRTSSAARAVADGPADTPRRETQVATSNRQRALPADMPPPPPDGSAPAGASQRAVGAQTEESGGDPERSAGTAARATPAGGSGTGSRGEGAGLARGGDGGGASAGGEGGGAGGVRAGALLSSGGERDITGNAPDRRSIATAAGRSRPEPSAWEGRVPPDLRSYVRDYFIAIRSVEGR